MVLSSLWPADGNVRMFDNTYADNTKEEKSSMRVVSFEGFYPCQKGKDLMRWAPAQPKRGALRECPCWDPPPPRAPPGPAGTAGPTGARTGRSSRRGPPAGCPRKR